MKITTKACLLPIEEDFIDLGVQTYREFGLDQLSAKLFCMLYLEPEEIAMDELAAKTGYSLASVSNKMAFLQGMGIVRRIKKPGSKKVFFFMEKDLFGLQRCKLDAFSEKYLRPAQDAIPKMLEKYKNEKQNSETGKRLEIISNYYKQVLKLEKLMDQLRVYLDQL